MKSPRKPGIYRHILLPCSAAITLAGAFSAQAADYPSTVQADHPLAYYRLEETSGTTAADSSEWAAFPATYVVNGTCPILGQPGIDTNSVSLQTAQPACVSAGYYPDFNPQGPFSFEIWVRPTSAPTGGDYRCPIGNFGGWGTGGSGWYVYQTPDPGSAFALVMQPTAVWISTSYSLFSWYHLVGTYDGANISFYVNGVLIGTQAANGYVANAGLPLGIGQRADGYGYFDGNVDEVAVYTNVLTLARVQAHYEAGTNSFRVAALPPTISRDPASTLAYAGHTVQFTVLADGTAPLKYQWYKGTTALSGQTGTALAFSCIPADDGTTYQVVVTNDVSSATSQVATLTVSTGLLIDAQPTSILRNDGSVAAFEVVAEGALPLRYQWYKNGSTLIPGATGKILWLNGVKLADDQSIYSAQISNPYTAIPSDPATLTVQARAGTVPITGYAKVVMADGPVAYWRLDEPTGSETAVDAAGSFDGSYLAGTGSFTFETPTGIPHESDTGVAIAGGATVSIPYAIELNSPDAFTAEGWFQPASLATDGNDYRTVFSSMSNPGGAGPTGWLLYQQGNNTWSWWPYGGFWASAQLTAPDTIVPNQWYHMALTYDGATFTFYVNGVAKTSGSYAGFVQNGDVPAGGVGTYQYNYAGSSPVTLGWRNPVDFHPFAGTMDDVAFYNKALTAQQVQLHYLNTVRLTISRSGSDVVLSWPFGTLQAAPLATGTYTNVPSATSPMTNAPTAAANFYRVKVQ